MPRVIKTMRKVSTPTTDLKRSSSINLEGLVRRVPPIIPTRSCTETVCHSFVTVAVSAFKKPRRSEATTPIEAFKPEAVQLYHVI